MKHLSHDEIQAALFEILCNVDDFCRQHGLRYSLAYGTLLGAVRHKGFIPWDDDVDILMPRADFERFVATFGKEEGARYRCLYMYEGDDARYMNFFAKVHDTTTVSYEERMKKSWRFGLNIDIFPVDGKPDTQDEQLRHERRLGHFVHRIFMSQRRILSFRDPIPAKIEALIFGSRHWVKKTVELMRKYDFDSSAFCGSVCTTYSGLIEIFPKEMFESYTELEFCGRKFMAFADWHGFLSRQFGNYMELPPVEKRKTHHLEVYKKDK